MRHFEVRVTSGSVRAFGVDFTRKAPGVQYDSLGLNGAYVSVLAKMFNADHWAEQLRHAKPDLVIINYGTNESVYAAFVDNSYGKELREIVRRVRVALPQTAILLMSPMDRGKREAGGEIGTVPTIPRLVGIQQTIAGEMGCGFFNTYLAMGGPGTMGRWYGAEPRLVGGDFIHPMPGGAKIVGNLLYQALFDAYNQYKVRQMQERLAKVSGKP
ncbi:MAG: GDSL-type esterase/lipase family protein [Bryobacteraceae bacterium]